MPYDVGVDPYIDSGSGILRNKLGITSQRELDAAEAEVTFAMISSYTIEGHLSLAEANAAALLDIHRHVFGDIYDWAGEFRNVELSKDTTRFAPAEFLPAQTETLLSKLRGDKGLTYHDAVKFVVSLAHYYCELNVLHPFREGNGRVIRTFLTMLADGLGWSIAWDGMTPQTNIEACVAGYRGDEEPLRVMLAALIAQSRQD